MSGRWPACVAPLLNWRDRLLSNPDFQRWSLRLPLVRWIARRRMRALFDLCSGFVYSQVLLACTRLGLFEELAQSPRSAADLEATLQLPRASLDRLLEAAESLRLIETRPGNRFGLGPLGAALLGNPSVAMMIEHHGAFYSDLIDPVALLRGEAQATALGRFWAYSRNASPAEIRSEDTLAYSELMASSQTMIAEQVLSAYPLRGHRRLLDVGGGHGAFVEAAMRKEEQIETCVFDLPSVAERARTRLVKLGFEKRVNARGGDFVNDPLPKDYDLVSLVRILHDHDDDVALILLQAIHEAISPDGVLLLAEPMLGTRGAEPVTAAYFGFYLMAMGQGRPRTVEEITSMLHKAGFINVKTRRTSAPLLSRVLTASPDKSVYKHHL